MCLVVLLFALCASCLLTSAVASPAYTKDTALLPAFVKVCRRSDPQLDACARRSFNALREHLAAGIPELFIPAIEPLVIPEIKMDQDSGAIFLHSTYRDVHVHGLSNFTLHHLSIDAAKMRLSMSMTFPNVTLRARYALRGKILMMPLTGDGDCKANLTDVELTTLILGQRQKKHGRTHIKVKEIKVSYQLGHVQLELGNLFNGDRALSARMNAFLNENWAALADEVRPMLESAMTAVVRASTDRLFDTYSYDDLLPE